MTVDFNIAELMNTTVLADTTIRAIGKRAHVMHNLGAFSLFCVLTAPMVYAPCTSPIFSQQLLKQHPASQDGRREGPSCHT